MKIRFEDSGQVVGNAHELKHIFETFYQGYLKENVGTSLSVQWLRLHLPVQGLQVQSLAWELGSQVPCDQKKTTTTENVKQKQYCNKLNKD